MWRYRRALFGKTPQRICCELTDPLTADGGAAFAGRTTPSIKYGGTREIPTPAAPPSLLGGTAPGRRKFFHEAVLLHQVSIRVYIT